MPVDWKSRIDIHPLSQGARTLDSTRPAAKPQSDQPTKCMANTVFERRRSLRAFCPKAHGIAKLELGLLHETILSTLTYAWSNGLLLYPSNTRARAWERQDAEEARRSGGICRKHSAQALHRSLLISLVDLGTPKAFIDRSRDSVRPSMFKTSSRGWLLQTHDLSSHAHWA